MTKPHSCSDPACGCGHDHAGDPAGPRFEVAQPPQPWRPRSYVRPVSIAVFEREEQILAAPVYSDAGQIKGWRPLGGEIEPGERAEIALIRELAEETGQTIEGLERLGVLENLYEHEGVAGHEIVFVFSARFQNAHIYDADQLAFRETPDGREDMAKWIPLARVRAGRTALFPDGLIDLI